MKLFDFFGRLIKRKADASPEPSKTPSRRTGDIGEELACRYLQKKGYRILARNIRYSHKELDIVAENSECTVIVEVKTRSGTEEENRAGGYGRASDKVDTQKARNLYYAAKRYLSEHYSGRAARIDVIEVYLPKKGKPDIHHIENAVTRQMLNHRRWR